MSETIPTSTIRIPDKACAIPRIGQVVTHFVLIEQLGRGVTGTVFLARDITLERYVAIKFLDHSVVLEIARKMGEASRKVNQELTCTLEMRFMREAKSAASISHTNLAQIYEANFEEDNWFIAMEYVQGDTLAELIQSVGNFSAKEIISLFRQTVLGLKYAWDGYHIVHRDVKPANIMVTEQGVVKIVDLGLAKPTRSTPEQRDKTSAGMPVGTPQYMAPEQARGEVDIDCHADIFALGATLYELCTAEKAFKGRTPAMVYNAQMKRGFKPIKVFRQDLPVELVELIEQMMNPAPEDRPGDHDLILEQLTTIEKDMNSNNNQMVARRGLESARTGSIDSSYFFPWEEMKSMQFWKGPLFFALAFGGILPVILTMTRASTPYLGWVPAIVIAYLWGVAFVRFLNPRRGAWKTVFMMGAVTASMGIPLFVGLTQLDCGRELYYGELTASGFPVWWKGILLIGLIEEAVKLAVLTLYPIDRRVAFRSGDFIFAGVMCGLVFSCKYGIAFSLAMWGHGPLTHSPDFLFFTMMLVAVPVLHASWGGISAWFVHSARVSGKMRWHLILVGWLVVGLLHGIWASFATTWGGVTAAVITFLLFRSYLRRESRSQSIMGTQRIRF